MLGVVCPPGFHAKVTGAVPPVILAVAEPSFPPKQFTSVLSTDKVKIGVEMVILSVMEQVPLASVTVTE